MNNKLIFFTVEKATHHKLILFILNETFMSNFIYILFYIKVKV